MSGQRSEPFPPSRRIVIDAGKAARRRHTVVGLIEVDITDAQARLEELEPRPSLTAFVVASTGRAVDVVPIVHAVRSVRNQLVFFDDVDINVMIEVELEGSSFPMNHVIRACNRKRLTDIDGELRAVKADPNSSPTLRLADQASLFLRLPGFIRHRMVSLLRRLPNRQRSLAGTVGISSVGMFGDGGGWGIGFSVHTLNIIVGGIVDRPGLVSGQVVPRRYLNLTLMFDHDLVDGAPAARFTAELRRILESGDVVEDELIA